MDVWVVDPPVILSGDPTIPLKVQSVIMRSVGSLITKEELWGPVYVCAESKERKKNII